jgi:hypothetical protein
MQYCDTKYDPELEPNSEAVSSETPGEAEPIQVRIRTTAKL